MKVVHSRTRFDLEAGALRVVAVADTHARPHPDLHRRVEALAPQRIVHAGDIGDASVLRALERHAPVTAVRGNVDPLGEPDSITIDVCDGDETLLRILLLHIAVNGPRLRPDAMRLAKRESASLVVCGHSHVPLVARDRGVTVFNPGSAGPRRFQLPILFGVIDVAKTGVSLRHVDCETGEPWSPGLSSE